ncbi:GNAT family N-acetyltransferase [Paenibacillus sp. PL91]|uniref:GNAT family N-acetyltransferase n=1 Tax=Paenibacillus sp. PL91 TaxID=2729538 RepID=UPI00145DFDD3|nr:GNAT family N-acetyltransferase [Paenibacillus sp. PL91]MBC9201964.1 GNAT family N-acetyltransferase [Paenibacillus sp. PL91]
MSSDFIISELSEISEKRLRSLAALLVEVVDEGASIGFLPPLNVAEATSYWSQVINDDVILWIAERNGEIVGSVQLHLCSRPNGTHRAEIAKLMVHPQARRKGLGHILMAAAEERARAENRSLLILDTRAGDPSNRLYRSMDYIEAGRIPRYAKAADGELHDTVYYYKNV